MQVLFMALFIVASAEATRHTYRRYGGGAIPLHVEDPPTPTVRPKKQRQPMPPPPVLFVNNEPEPSIIVFAEPVHLHVRNVLPYLPPQVPTPPALPALPAPVVDQGTSFAPQARPPCGKCGKKQQVVGERIQQDARLKHGGRIQQNADLDHGGSIEQNAFASSGSGHVSRDAEVDVELAVERVASQQNAGRLRGRTDAVIKVQSDINILQPASLGFDRSDDEDSCGLNSPRCADLNDEGIYPSDDPRGHFYRCAKCVPLYFRCRDGQAYEASSTTCV